MNYGLQLFSVRDAAGQNFEEMLRQVAEMGYAMVQPAGFFDLKAADVAAMLKHYGLALAGTHTSYKSLTDPDQLGDIVAFHKAIGCKDIVIPGVPGRLGTRECVDQFIKTVNTLQPRLAAEGIDLHYHNHFWEFRPNEDGMIAEEVVAEETDILFEIDTFWAFNAGRDPIEVLERYKDRIRIIHLKDGYVQDFSDPESKPVGKSLGLGQAPVAAVRKKAIDLGLDIVVESEGLEPTGLDEVKRCIDYLKDLDAKDGK